MSLHAAIDLHSSNSVLAVMDGQGKPLLQRRRPNDLSRLLTDLAPFRDELTGVAVESTDNWYWLVDGPMDRGYIVHPVNTTAIPQYDDLKLGNDYTDALHLAQRMRLGLLAEGCILGAAGNTAAGGRGKTGRCSSSRTGKSTYASVDSNGDVVPPGGEMVTPFLMRTATNALVPALLQRRRTAGRGSDCPPARRVRRQARTR
ncbi:IS110 family transposase [Rhodanobacter geophilus]|uniref:Transposase n=1 Tax=Rhodanobacter geophilus TaxID=3162488 RepID=A0ABV3QNU3_9GAMM